MTIKKPTIKSEWAGQKGNKFRVYVVTNEGKTFFHHNKANAMRQYEAAVRVYNRLKSRKTK